jgi:hypothetical protein
MSNENITQLLAVAVMLVSATIWLTSRIHQLRLVVERRIKEHELECDNYAPGSGSRRLHDGCAE